MTMEIPPRGTRGSGGLITGPLMRLLQPMAGMMVSRYRRNATDEPPRFMGFPTVLLTTIGARTGKERTHVLGGFRQEDGSWLVMASKGGAATHPAWFINLAKHPDQVWVEAGKRKFKARPELLKGEERDRALAEIVAGAPRYGEYQHKTDRVIPIVRLTPES